MLLAKFFRGSLQKKVFFLILFFNWAGNPEKRSGHA
jgi:hypothetical protein